MIQLIVFLVAVYIISLLVHEYFHWIYARIVLRDKSADIIIYFDSWSSFGLRTRARAEQLNHIYEFHLSGILAGLIVILIAGWFSFISYAVLPFYLLGCKKDILKIRRIRQWLR